MWTEIIFPLHHWRSSEVVRLGTSSKQNCRCCCLCILESTAKVIIEQRLICEVCSPGWWPWTLIHCRLSKATVCFRPLIHDIRPRASQEPLACSRGSLTKARTWVWSREAPTTHCAAPTNNHPIPFVKKRQQGPIYLLGKGITQQIPASVTGKCRKERRAGSRQAPIRATEPRANSRSAT